MFFFLWQSCSRLGEKREGRRERDRHRWTETEAEGGTETETGTCVIHKERNIVDREGEREKVRERRTDA